MFCSVSLSNAFLLTIMVVIDIIQLRLSNRVAIFLKGSPPLLAILFLLPFNFILVPLFAILFLLPLTLMLKT